MSTRGKTVKKAAPKAVKKTAEKSPRPAAMDQPVRTFDSTGDLAKLQEQVRLLLEENKRLSDELDQSRQQSGSLERATAEAVAVRAKVEKEIQAIQVKFDAQNAQLAQLTTTNRTLEAQVRRLSVQVRGTDFSPLTPEEASALIQKTVGSFTSGTLQVQDIDLTLKVSTGRLGTEPVLVLPIPGKADASTIHELKLKLRNPALLEEALKPK